jgi:Zn-dependent peptidase ImmA (M78 family)
VSSLLDDLDLLEVMEHDNADAPKANLRSARRAALALLQHFAVTHPHALVLEESAMAHGVLVLEERLEGAEAHLLHTTGKGVMRVRAALPELGRKRFAIAHELGHWELHAHFLHGVVCTDMDMLNSSVSPPEIEANTFASELLMPTALFRPRCAHAGPNLTRLGRLAVTS